MRKVPRCEGDGHLLLGRKRSQLTWQSMRGAGRSCCSPSPHLPVGTQLWLHGPRAVARDLSVGSCSGLSGDLGQALMPPGILPTLISWFMSLPGTASLTFCWGEHTRLSSQNCSCSLAASICRNRRVKVKAGIAEERSKAQRERQRVGFEHGTCSMQS